MNRIQRPELAPDQPTEVTHAELCARAVKWLLGTGKCSVAVSEIVSAAREVPDAIGWAGQFSILIEVKTSRADFLRDKHKPWRRVHSLGMGSQRFYLCPPGVIDATSVPEQWGLLHAHGRHIKIVKRSEGFARRHRSAEIALLVSVLRRERAERGSLACRGNWDNLKAKEQA